MKISIVLLLAIFLCSATILFGIYSSTDSGKPHPEKLTLKNNLLYYFGDNSTTWTTSSTKYSEETVLLFENVSEESNRDLVSRFYPSGSFMGVGYSGHELVVLMHKDYAVNETHIREIYSVIERHGEEQGMKRIPCKFLSMGTVKTGYRQVAPGLPLDPWQGLYTWVTRCGAQYFSKKNCPRQNIGSYQTTPAL